MTESDITVDEGDEEVSLLVVAGVPVGLFVAEAGGGTLRLRLVGRFNLGTDGSVGGGDEESAVPASFRIAIPMVSPCRTADPCRTFQQYNLYGADGNRISLRMAAAPVGSIPPPGSPFALVEGAISYYWKESRLSLECLY